MMHVSVMLARLMHEQELARMVHEHEYLWTPESTMTTDQLNAATLAQVLDEPMVALLAQVLQLLSPERTIGALVEALTIEAAGGPAGQNAAYNNAGMKTPLRLC
jgi:hypothetical protein